MSSKSNSNVQSVSKLKPISISFTTTPKEPTMKIHAKKMSVYHVCQWVGWLVHWSSALARSNRNIGLSAHADNSDAMVFLFWLMCCGCSRFFPFAMRFLATAVGIARYDRITYTLIDVMCVLTCKHTLYVTHITRSTVYIYWLSLILFRPQILSPPKWDSVICYTKTKFIHKNMYNVHVHISTLVVSEWRWTSSDTTTKCHKSSTETIRRW